MDGLVHFVGANISQHVHVRVVQFYHVLASAFKDTGALYFSLLNQIFKFNILCGFQVKVYVAYMVTVWVWFSYIKVSVGSLWDIPFRRNDNRFVEAEVFLVETVRRFRELFSNLYKHFVLIVVLAKYSDVASIGEIVTNRFFTELVAFKMGMPNGFQEFLFVFNGTKTIEFHFLYVSDASETRYYNWLEPEIYLGYRVNSRFYEF